MWLPRERPFARRRVPDSVIPERVEPLTWLANLLLHLDLRFWTYWKQTCLCTVGDLRRFSLATIANKEKICASSLPS